MDVIRHPKFNKKLKRIPAPVKRALVLRLRLFRENRFHPLLHDHALTGDREGYRSINITGDWRLIYEPIQTNVVRLMDIDTHHNLYGT
jgi:addiction module RelE/StbE family toxin